MECIKRSFGWKEVLSWPVLWAALVSGNSAFAAFTDDMAEGLDNSSFTYQPYEDGAFAPSLVAGQGVGGGDAVRTGQPYQSTATISAEGGLFFDFTGPGTLTFQWSVDGQPIVGGVGSLLQYYLIGTGGTNAFISGRNVGFQQVVLPVPEAESYRFFVSYTRSAGSVAQGEDAGWIDQMVWTPSGSSDTTPDAFSFNAQSGVPLSTMVESNATTISGINAAADISISGCSSSCEYSINSGGWTSASAAAAVSNGDSIQVRQTSSASYVATTTLTLDIGSVTAPFNVTTESEPESEPVVVGESPTGTGTVSAFVEAAGNSAPGCNVSEAALVGTPVPPPEGVTLPHGMFSFTSTGCTSGFSVNVTVEYPSAIPEDANYWKYDETLGWYTIPATIVGNTVSFTITDNGTGDSNNTAGTITDPGGIGLGASILAPNGIPTMSRWSLAVLAAVLAALAGFRMRRRTA